MDKEFIKKVEEMTDYLYAHNAHYLMKNIEDGKEMDFVLNLIISSNISAIVNVLSSLFLSTEDNEYKSYILDKIGKLKNIFSSNFDSFKIIKYEN